jgi:hypothetical protein
VNWQHLNILAATNYLRERIASGAPDSKAKDVYDGLLDVLDPSRIDRRAKGIAVDEPVRLRPDTPGQAKPPTPRRRRSRKKSATTRRATPARRPPARPARPAKPRRR